MNQNHIQQPLPSLALSHTVISAVSGSTTLILLAIKILFNVALIHTVFFTLGAHIVISIYDIFFTCKIFNNNLLDSKVSNVKKILPIVSGVLIGVISNVIILLINFNIPVTASVIAVLIIIRTCLVWYVVKSINNKINTTISQAMTNVQQLPLENQLQPQTEEVEDQNIFNASSMNSNVQIIQLPSENQLQPQTEEVEDQNIFNASSMNSNVQIIQLPSENQLQPQLEADYQDISGMNYNNISNTQTIQLPSENQLQPQNIRNFIESHKVLQSISIDTHMLGLILLAKNFKIELCKINKDCIDPKNKPKESSNDKDYILASLDGYIQMKLFIKNIEYCINIDVDGAGDPIAGNSLEAFYGNIPKILLIVILRCLYDKRHLISGDTINESNARNIGKYINDQIGSYIIEVTVTKNDSLQIANQAGMCLQCSTDTLYNNKPVQLDCWNLGDVEQYLEEENNKITQLSKIFPDLYSVSRFVLYFFHFGWSNSIMQQTINTGFDAIKGVKLQRFNLPILQHILLIDEFNTSTCDSGVKSVEWFVDLCKTRYEKRHGKKTNLQFNKEDLGCEATDYVRQETVNRFNELFNTLFTLELQNQELSASNLGNVMKDVFSVENYYNSIVNKLHLYENKSDHLVQITYIKVLFLYFVMFEWSMSGDLSAYLKKSEFQIKYNKLSRLLQEIKIVSDPSMQLYNNKNGKYDVSYCRECWKATKEVNTSSIDLNGKKVKRRIICSDGIGDNLIRGDGGGLTGKVTPEYLFWQLSSQNALSEFKKFYADRIHGKKEDDMLLRYIRYRYIDLSEVESTYEIGRLAIKPFVDITPKEYATLKAAQVFSNEEQMEIMQHQAPQQNYLANDDVPIMPLGTRYLHHDASQTIMRVDLRRRKSQTQYLYNADFNTIAKNHNNVDTQQQNVPMNFIGNFDHTIIQDHRELCKLILKKYIASGLFSQEHIVCIQSVIGDMMDTSFKGSSKKEDVLQIIHECSFLESILENKSELKDSLLKSGEMTPRDLKALMIIINNLKQEYHKCTYIEIIFMLQLILKVCSVIYKKEKAIAMVLMRQTILPVNSTKQKWLYQLLSNTFTAEELSTKPIGLHNPTLFNPNCLFPDLSSVRFIAGSKLYADVLQLSTSELADTYNVNVLNPSDRLYNISYNANQFTPEQFEKCLKKRDANNTFHDVNKTLLVKYTNYGFILLGGIYGGAGSIINPGMMEMIPDRALLLKFTNSNFEDLNMDQLSNKSILSNLEMLLRHMIQKGLIRPVLSTNMVNICFDSESHEISFDIIKVSQDDFKSIGMRSDIIGAIFTASSYASYLQIYAYEATLKNAKPFLKDLKLICDTLDEAVKLRDNDYSDNLTGTTDLQYNSYIKKVVDILNCASVKYRLEETVFIIAILLRLSAGECMGRVGIGEQEITGVHPAIAQVFLKLCPLDDQNNKFIVTMDKKADNSSEKEADAWRELREKYILSNGFVGCQDLGAKSIKYRLSNTIVYPYFSN